MAVMESAGRGACQLRRGGVVRTLARVIGLAFLTACHPVHGARAADGPPEPSAHGDWLGAWVGLEARGGLAVTGADPTRGGLALPTPRALGGLSGRLATLMSLVDLDLGVTWRGLRAPPATSRPLATSAMLEARLHPFFMRHLRADWVTAALYVSFGLGADVVSWDGPERRHAAGVALQVGAGGDVPLTAPRDGSPSVWLGVGYRLRISGVPGAPAGLRDRDGHDVWLGLSLRWHGVDFMRLPRPPELDDRDD